MGTALHITAYTLRTFGTLLLARNVVYAENVIRNSVLGLMNMTLRKIALQKELTGNNP